MLRLVERFLVSPTAKALGTVLRAVLPLRVRCLVSDAIAWSVCPYRHRGLHYFHMDGWTFCGHCGYGWRGNHRMHIPRA